MILVAFLLLQLADLLTTVRILRAGGIELNPLLPNDWRWHIVVKIFIVAAIAVDGRALPLATPLSALVVMWNVRQIFRSRRRAQEVQ